MRGFRYGVAWISTCLFLAFALHWPQVHFGVDKAIAYVLGTWVQAYGLVALVAWIVPQPKDGTE